MVSHSRSLAQEHDAMLTARRAREPRRGRNGPRPLVGGAHADGLFGAAGLDACSGGTGADSTSDCEG